MLKVNKESEQYFTIAGYSKCSIMPSPETENIIIVKSGVGSMAYHLNGEEHPVNNPWKTKGEWHPATFLRKGSPYSLVNLNRDMAFANALNRALLVVKDIFNIRNK